MPRGAGGVARIREIGFESGLALGFGNLLASLFEAFREYELRCPSQPVSFGLKLSLRSIDPDAMQP